MIQVSIEPNAIYSADELGKLLDVSDATLAHARRQGTLRATRKGRRVLFLGKWVLAWLESEEGGVDAK